MKTFRFCDWECKVLEQRYSDNGRLALEVVTEVSGYPDRVAMATTNLPEIELGPGEVLIKCYAENAGLLEKLEEAGIVRRTGKFVQGPFDVRMEICEYLGAV